MIKSANGASGFLLHTLDHWVFRVYSSPGKFTDYDLLHSDLGVTINDSDAAFYCGRQRHALDHSPSTLGLNAQLSGPSIDTEQVDCSEFELGAKTPRELLEFLAGRFEFSGISDGVAWAYARNIRDLLAKSAD